MPKNMAIKFGKSTPFKAIFMNMHYNNPEGDTNATDSTGFTAFLTTKPREHEYVSTALRSTLHMRKKHVLSGASCTSVALQQDAMY
jgi:hypothetical protein